MTNREAMEIVLKMADGAFGMQTYWEHYNDDGIKEDDAREAIFQMQDYMNDLMREEPATGCDYGIGG
jgi:chemotaxis regulatin CheY-phosphate phosphatase CheZ